MLKKFAAAVFAVWAGVAGAQSLTTVSGTITTQNLVAAGDCTAGSCVEIDVTGIASVTVQTKGTYTGALSAQVTVDRKTWVTECSSSCTTTFTRRTTGAQTATITSGQEDVYQVQFANGAKRLRITGLAAVTGTANITIQPSNVGAGSSSSASGGGLTDAELRATPVPVSGTVTATPTGTQAVSAASGTFASGALASGSVASGAMVDLGTQADVAAAGDTSTASLIALTKRNNQNLSTLNTSITADPNYSQAPGSAVPSRALYVAGRTGANAAAVPISGLTAAITMSTATTTQFIALSGTTLTYISSLSIIAGGTTNVTLVYGTGSNCATGQTALTGAYPLTAQTGLALSGMPAIVVPSGQALCVTSSAAVQVSGHVTHTQF